MTKNIRNFGDLSELVFGMPAGKVYGVASLSDVEPTGNVAYFGTVGAENEYQVWTEVVALHDKTYFVVYAFLNSEVEDIQDEGNYPWDDTHVVCFWKLN